MLRLTCNSLVYILAAFKDEAWIPLPREEKRETRGKFYEAPSKPPPRLLTAQVTKRRNFSLTPPQTKTRQLSEADTEPSNSISSAQQTTVTVTEMPSTVVSQRPNVAQRPSVSDPPTRPVPVPAPRARSEDKFAVLSSRLILDSYSFRTGAGNQLSILRPCKSIT